MAHVSASLRKTPCWQTPHVDSAGSAAVVPHGRYTRSRHAGAPEHITKGTSPSRRHSSSGEWQRGQGPSAWPPGGSAASLPPPPAARGKNCATSASIMPGQPLNVCFIPALRGVHIALWFFVTMF